MPSSNPRLTFYFLHLLGVGHVYRSQRLIEGFAKKGIAVDVIYGGDPVSGISFAAETVSYLPPIRSADNAYSRYLDENGHELSTAYLERRKSKLLKIFDDLQSDMILFEAFPFGRRMVRHEIQALLKAARERIRPPLIVSSVRDILQERKKPGRNEETLSLIENYFDHILVHSDPGLIALDATFPFASRIAEKISYTGFVVPQAREGSVKPDGYDIVISAGGGAFGGDLMRAALELSRKDPFPGWRWCLSTGPNLDKQQTRALRQNAPDHVTIVERLEDLAQHMKAARLTVSQCGYNTAMDTLAAQSESDCKVVFVPYDTEGQTEQLKRAELLQEKGYATTVPQSKLTIENLETAMKQALNSPKPSHNINFDGVSNAARLVLDWLSDRGAV